MMLPSRGERGVVVFKVWPDLAYGRRMALAFGLVAAGLALQLATASFLVGLVPLALGNLLLLVSGYDNRVDFKAFDPGAHWERIELERLDELLRLDRKIRRWDLSALDVTNGLGALVFLVVAAGLGGLAFAGEGFARILGLDGLVLLLPHWVTGVRRVLRLPKLVLRAGVIRAVLRSNERELAPHRVQLLAALRGDAQALPEDLKFKVELAEHDDDFLGLYGQVVLNAVQGTSHPYFYVVLVARKGYGLEEVHRRYTPPHDLTKELKRQDEVEVLVLRRTTTKTSGYATKPAFAAQILGEGLALAEEAAVRPSAA